MEIALILFILQFVLIFFLLTTGQMIAFSTTPKKNRKVKALHAVYFLSVIVFMLSPLIVATGYNDVFEIIQVGSGALSIILSVLIVTFEEKEAGKKQKMALTSRLAIVNIFVIILLYFFQKVYIERVITLYNSISNIVQATAETQQYFESLISRVPFGPLRTRLSNMVTRFTGIPLNP